MRGFKRRRDVRFMSMALAMLLVISGAGFGGPTRVVAASSSVRDTHTHDATPRATADVLDRNGKVRLHVESTTLAPSSLVGLIRELQKNRELLTAWRARVEQVAKLSKRSAATAARTLTLIDALSAPTQHQFHQRVQRLGVGVERRSTSNAQGIRGVQTSYIVRGAVKMRLFVPTRAAVAPPPPASDSFVPEGDEGLDAPETVAAAPTTLQEDCGGEPCATQQEIDDAMATLVAIDDENNALDAEMSAEMAEIDEWCNQNPWECEGSPDPDAVQSGPWVADADARPCSSEFWNFAGAVLSTNGAVILGVAALFAAATAPIAALVVAGTVVAAAGGLAWSYSGAISLLDCKRRTLLLQP